MTRHLLRMKWNFFSPIFLFAFIVLGLSHQAFSQTPIYSRGGGGNVWTNSGAWSLTGHGGGSCACIPNASHDVKIGAGHSYTIPSNSTVTVNSIEINANGAGGTLTLGNNSNTAITLTTGDLTVNTGGVIRMGGDGGAVHALTVNGNIINDGTIDLVGTNGDVANVTSGGTTAKSISGTPAQFDFSGFTVAGTNAHISLESDIRIFGTLNWTSNGLIIVDANSSITMGPSAAVTNASASRYVQLDGSSGADSEFIKTSNNSTGSWAILYPIGTATGGYTPLDLRTANGATITTAPTNNSLLRVKVIYNPSNRGQLRRQFRLTVVGNSSATTFANADFYYSPADDISTGDIPSDYNTPWTLSIASGVWTPLTGTAPGTTFFTTPSVARTLGTGTYYYTIGNATAFTNTWYSYQTGMWDDPEVWTLDPSGTSFVNPTNTVPASGDAVVILNGFTITSNVNNLTLSATTIQGGAALDLSTTSGHNLGAVSGQGFLRVKGPSLPTGTYTSFVASTGGTIEYYDIGGTLTTQGTYNKLIFSNSTGSDITFVSDGNLTINGTLNVIQTGGGGKVTWQINGSTNTSRTVSIVGDITVGPGGNIDVGPGNAGSTTPHNVTLYGNIVNEGSIRFFDPGHGTFSEANYTSGAIYTATRRGNAAAVTFSGVTNQTVTCNGVTDFYRLIVNKGTGQQAILTINSSSVTNFRLFAPNNQDMSGAAPNYISDNALSLVNGTLELQGSINIPTLVVNGGGGIGGGWPIPQNAALWVNSADVTVQVTNTTDTGDNGRQMYVFGKLQLTKGTINLGYSRGLLGGGSGVFIIEGGTLNTRQLRTTYLGSNNRFSYTQTGGVVNVGTAGISGVDVNTYPRFALPYSECSFSMSGGTLNVAQPITSGTSNSDGLLIFAAASNIQVSGGEVNVILPASNVNFNICSTAPFYDLNISKTGGGNSVAALSAVSFNDNTGYTRAAQPLTVLRNLVLVSNNNPGFTCNNNNLTIGGDFNIQSGTTFTPGSNTITFNGSSTQTWSYNGTITSLNNIVVNKTGTLQMAGATLPMIEGLSLDAGTLDDGGNVITVHLTLSNSAVHQGTGAIGVNGPTAITGNNGTFGNLSINSNSTVSVTGTQTVTGALRLINTSSSLNIGINSFTVLGGIYSNSTTGTAFTTAKRIITNGYRNDGGLTRAATLGQPLLFPVGTPTVAYTPITIRVDAATTVGRITVRAVRSAHPNVTATNASLQYFWRVTSTGFTGVTDVTHTSYTFASAAKSGTLTDYHVARYDAETHSWAYRTAAFDATSATAISPANFETGTGWTGLNSDKLDGEYTAGNTSAFGTVLVYYSRVTSGNWGATSSWSNDGINGDAGSTTPCATCPVVIGDATNNHTININANNQRSGSLSVATGSVLDCGTYTGLSFGDNAPVSGNGKIRIASANFPSGDFLNFLGEQGGTIEWYGPSYTIPTTGPAPFSIALNRYYNLQVSPNSGVTILMPATDLFIYRDFTVSGASGTAQVNSSTAAARTITVGNDFNVTSGTFSIRNGVVSTFEVNGNTTVASGATLTVQNGGATRTHAFTTPGNIINEGTLRFRGGNEVVNITFTGSSNTAITGSNAGANTTLNGITVDKGTSQAQVLAIDVAGTLTTLSNNWVTITNGTIDFNKSGGTFVLTNSGNNPFSIPSTGKLKVSQGTVSVSNINNDNSDVLLAGAIEVAGGTLNVGSSTNNNDNDIEYAAAGTPTISISGGTLYVNGAIRRATTTLSGALVYEQTGGTVTVAGRSANNTRAVFEIENSAGSSFTLTGTGTLSILRPTGGTLFPDFYLNPAISSVDATSTIYLGISGTNQTIDINVVPSLGNLFIHANTTASMQSSTLTTAGTLTIGTNNGRLLTNSLDVTIGGDLAINGTGVYDGTVGSGNTTIFNGTGPQSAALSSGSTFLNMTVSKPAGTVTLSGTSPTITNLNIFSGVLDVNNLNLSVIGDIVNNSSQINSAGGSILLAGGTSVTVQNITSSGGSFGNLTLSGASTSKTVNVTGNIAIDGTLTFSTTNRYLSVGSSQVTFGSSSSVSGAGGTAFIRTNGVPSDLGIMRTWAVGTATFVYPIGTRTNYTPVTVTLTVTSPGDLTVIPVDDRHPTANTGSTEQILNYYWVITRGSTLAYSATGSHVYAFPATLMGGSGGTLRAGYLDINSATPGWITSTHGGTATGSSMTFTNLLSSNLPSAGNSFHYSVGTVNTLPNPITPIYSRLSDPAVANVNIGGDWNDPNSWTLSPTGIGPAWGSIPYGNSVVILPNSRVNISTTGRISFITQIDGLLSLPGNKVGHNFGILRGTGTMRTTTSTLPAGNYTSFVSSGGGTIEYVGPMTMNNRSTYNNLSIIGSGNVIMTNTDLILNGNLSVASGSTLSNTTNNRNISIAGNWTNAGTVNIGTGTVTFTGGNAQAITTTSNFYNVTIAKSANNVTLSSPTTITNNLTLTTRHIVASTTSPLILGSSTITGGSANSFIAGTVTKIIPLGTSSYSMPLGSVAANRYRPAAIGNPSANDTWTFEYVPNDPSDDGLPTGSRDAANLAKISGFEYWNISRAGSTVADLTLTYGPGSYIPPNIGVLSSLRVVKWNAVSSRWELATGVAPTGFVVSGNNISGTVRAPQVTSFSPHTFGSTDPVSPLPIELIYFRATLVHNQVELMWETASEKNNDYFTVEKATNPESFESLVRVEGKGTTSARSKYTAVDPNPYLGLSYYRLKQTDFDGRTSYSKPQPIQYDGPEFTTIEVYPNPAASGESFTIEVRGLHDETTVPLQIFNAQGQTLYFQNLEVKTKGYLKEVITLPTPLNTGIYLIKAGPYLPMIKKLVVE